MSNKALLKDTKVKETFLYKAGTKTYLYMNVGYLGEVVQVNIDTGSVVVLEPDLEVELVESLVKHQNVSVPAGKKPFISHDFSKQSSWLTKAFFYPELDIMTLYSDSRTIGDYNISEDIFEQFCQADSPGYFFNHYIYENVIK